jgi:general secretion pathway protein L
MSTLILTFPLTTGNGAPEYDYVLTPDGLQLGAQGRASAALLPAQPGRGTEVVALIPARALSWHCISLPERVLSSLLRGRLEPARVRGVLTGVLEEQLLDDAEQLHFAVFAAPAAEAGAAPRAWVAVCGRAWLQSSLQALEAAGHRVARIVAECTPAQPGTATALLSGEMQPAQMLLCTPQGVSLLPLLPASLALAQAQSSLEVFAEPAVMALAEKHFGSRATLQTHGQRLLQAAQSPWNLAQLEFSASRGGRFFKVLASFWQQVWRAPQWRPARWSVLALLLVQVLALNALAWRQRALLDDKRAAVQAVLTQTFPEVRLVIDAPLQMQRAVDDLARAHGVGSGTDLGRVLSIISPLAPPGMRLSAITLTSKQLRLGATGLDPATVTNLTAALDARGLRAQLQDGQLVVETKEAH